MGEAARFKRLQVANGYKSVCGLWASAVADVTILSRLGEEIELCNSILSSRFPSMTGDMKDRMVLSIGISMGLGEIFDDDEHAEIEWLTSKRSEFGGIGPLEHMLKGDLSNVRDVADMVDRARGLQD